MLSDIDYSFRLLRRSPAFFAASVATLSLGIGATTAIFAVFERVVLHPLPIEEPDRVVVLHRAEGARLSRAFQYPAVQRFQQQTEAIFSSVAISGDGGMRVRVGDDTQLASAAFVTAGYFEQLGVQLTRGRVFTRDEYRSGAGLVTVASDAFWRERMAADPRAIGRGIRVGDATATVIGIAPRGFRGLEIASPVDLFIPLLAAPLVLPEGNWFSESLVRFEGRGYSPQSWLDVIGRLRPGVSRAQAEALLSTVTIDARPADPATRLRLIPASAAALSFRTGAETTRFATMLAIVVSLVLLIGCTNLAGLILSRNQQRRREVAVRLALGATRARVVRLFLTESVLLSLAGTAGGVLVSVWMLQAIAGFVIPGGIDVKEMQLVLTGRLIGFAAATAFFAAVVSGLLPALTGSRPDLVDALKGRSDAHFGGGGVGRSVLVAVQVAISVVLVIGAVLFARSLRAALATDVGTDASRIGYASVSLWGAGYDRARLATLNGALVERLNAQPGVESVTYGELPLVGFPGSTQAFKIDGIERQLPQTLVFPAGPGYFDTVGLRILAGAAPSGDDEMGGRPVVVVNESFARNAWPGADPLGRRVFVRPQGPELEVVGVARDGKYANLRDAGRPAIYVPWLLANVQSSETILVRTTGSPSLAAAAIQREIRRLDPALAILSAGTLEGRIADLAMTQRMGASLLGWFSVLAVTLALLGVYGLIAYAAALRAAEIGIRIALGGAASDVVRLMLRQALAPVAAGIAVGTAGAYALSRLARSFLFGIEPHDPLSFAAAGLVFLALVLVAAYLPARRASRVDPVVALRAT